MPSSSSRGLRRTRMAAAAAQAAVANGESVVDSRSTPKGPATRRRLATTGGNRGRPSLEPSSRRYSVARPPASSNERTLQPLHRQREQKKVVSSLEEALKANRKLQQAIRQQLARLVERQTQTRIEAEACLTEQLVRSGILRPSNQAEEIADGLYPGWLKPREIQAFFQRSQNPPGHVTNNTSTTTTTSTPNGPRDPTTKASIEEPAELVANTTITTTASPSASPPLPPNKVRQIRYQPFRRWTLEYFVDPTGSRPSSNADTIYRQQLREQFSYGSHSDAEAGQEESVFWFDYQQQGSPSWTSEEHAVLDELVGTAAADKKTAEGIDFVSLAKELSLRCPLPRTDASAPVHSTCTPLKRSPKECEFMYRRRQQQKYPFTKDESLWILEGVHALQSGGTQNLDPSKGSCKINEKDTAATNKSTSEKGTWSQIAQMVNERRRQQQRQKQQQQDPNITSEAATFLEPTRTAWQCFCHYKQHLEQRNGPAMSQSFQEACNTQQQEQQRQEDDEILLRYLAHHGPQFVWDTNSSTHAASRLFGSTGISDSSNWTPLQIFQRSNWTAVFNPNLTAQPYWTSKPEQKLVLLMKIYHPTGNHSEQNSSEHEDEDSHTCLDLENNGEKKGGKMQDSGTHKRKRGTPTTVATQSKKKQPHVASIKPLSAMAKAAPHFPERTRQQVAHKWERSLNPTLDHDKFTPQEDTLLRAILTKALRLSSSKGVDNPKRLPLLTSKDLRDHMNNGGGKNNENQRRIDGDISTRASDITTNDPNKMKKQDASERLLVHDGDSIGDGNRTQDDGNSSSMSHPSPPSSWKLPPRIRDIAKEHFPNRRPHQVYARWLEIATPQEMADYHGLHLLLGKSGKDSASTLHLAASFVSPEDLRLEWIGDEKPEKD